jgi:hypothetical protein
MTIGIEAIRPPGTSAPTARSLPDFAPETATP